MSSELDRVIAAERAARLAEAKERHLGGRPSTPPRTSDAPTTAVRVPAGVLEQGQDAQGHPAWVLDGVPLRVGDVIEVFTNRAHGWLRGRFEWRGGTEEPPRLAINVWDPSGPRDEDGLPPWVGELDARIPAGARVRRG